MIEVNVLKVLAAGGNPLTHIRKVAEDLAPGESVRVVAPFEPKPLLEMLGVMDLRVETEKGSGPGYVVIFHREIMSDSGNRIQ
jgi:hypothetical protein